MYYLSELAFEYENHIVKVENLAKLTGTLPGEIQKFLDLVLEYDKSEEGWEAYMKEYGGSTAAANHPDHGWALLGAGQGPCILWMENPPDEYKKRKEEIQKRKQQESEYEF